MRASSSDRIVSCPASLVLPRVREENPSRDTAAAYGTLVHHWMETGESRPAWARPDHVNHLERKLKASGIRREDWWPGGVHESTWALNLRTLDLRKYTGEARGRDAWKETWSPLEWLTGTIDWSNTDPLSADDLKTGWCPEVRYNKQLLSYGLFLWLDSGRAEDLIYLSITHWPKYPLAGLPVRHQWVATSVDLECHLADLQFSASNLNLEVFDGNGRGHCRFCESKKHCNEWRKNERRV